MEHPDRVSLEKELHESTAAIETATAGASDEEARKKPNPDCWSMLECLEHIVLVDQGFSSRLNTAKKSDTPLIDPDRERRIRENTPKRVTRFAAPPQVVPTGRYQSIGEALEGLRDSRARLVNMIEEKKNELRVLEVQHPVLGPVSGYEAFLLIAAHGVRHANQIQEMRSSSSPTSPTTQAG